MTVFLWKNPVEATMLVFCLFWTAGVLLSKYYKSTSWEFLEAMMVFLTVFAWIFSLLAFPAKDLETFSVYVFYWLIAGVLIMNKLIKRTNG